MSEELSLRHCSPTLAGMKTGSLFSCPCPSAKALAHRIRRYNRQLSAKGLRIIPLRFDQNRALIYVYRPKKLMQDLSHPEARALLADLGYRYATAEQCVAQLCRRLRQSKNFPHEIGLFLGYPIEDVKGFLCPDCAPTCIGCWKAYGDPEKAKKLFCKYRKCTRVYLHSHTNGNTLERLTVAC